MAVTSLDLLFFYGRRLEVKKAIQLLFFLIVQIPLMPVAIIGLVLVMYK